MNLKDTSQFALITRLDMRKWRKLPPKELNCNVNAALMDNKVEVGMCLRGHDSWREISKRKNGDLSLLIVCVGKGKVKLILAQLHAIGWLVEFGLNNIFFKLEAKVVVDNFINPSTDLSYFNFIFRRLMLDIANFVIPTSLIVLQQIFIHFHLLCVF